MSYLLRAPVVVVAPDGEHELQRGVLTIGRLQSCDVYLEDPLVSRVHARVSVMETGIVAVEDLHSTNGVFVNGVRVARGLKQLRDGDRLLIGTTELSLFADRSRGSDKPTVRVPPDVAPAIAASAEARAEDVPVTDRADALDVIGRLATRLAKSGNVAEAARVLSSQLNKILLGATAGLSVPSDVLERATQFAVDLFRWTNNVAWIDYALELHLAVQCVPSEHCMSLLDTTLSNPGVPFDRKLLVHFVENLATRRATLGEDERWRLGRLERIVRGQGLELRA